MSSEVVIEAVELGKSYHIYRSPKDRLIQSLLRGRKNLYREFWALKGVSFEVRKGETVGVIGRNGSGKSTLLQILCGTLALTTGSVQVHGRVAALLELGAGFSPDFTGRENVYLNGTIMGLTTDEIDARFDDIAAFADIGEYMEQPVKTYSSGMEVRLAFAVVAHLDADILVIDEALAVGDVFFTQKCMRYLRAFRERGTIFFVSHDTAAVVNLCHRVLWLHGGEPKAYGPAKEVCEAYLSGLMPAQDSHAITFAPEPARPRRGRMRKVEDQRREFINRTPYRNDIELFSFDTAAAGFGKGGARITEVALLNENQSPLSWVVGGEVVALVIEAEVYERLAAPVVGFLLKDRLGQILFADNTYLTTLSEPVSVEAGEVLEARFLFQMPILLAGSYTVTAAIADLARGEPEQHHWVHDALALQSHSSSVIQGLMGVPMIEVRLSKQGRSDGE